MSLTVPTGRQIPAPSKYPEPALGGYGAQDHGRMVDWLCQVNRQLEINCTGLYREMVAHAGIYLGQRVDPRKPHEKWRSNLHIPYGSSAIDTAVAAELDILLSANPWVQVEGVGEEDKKNARSIENAIQHTLTVNNWPVEAKIGLQNKHIYGTQLWKVSNRPRYSKVYIEYSKADLDDWQKRVQDLSMLSGIPCPDPDAPEDFPGQSRMLFEAWRDIMLKSGKGRVPDKPVSGWKNVMVRNAPDISNQSLFDIRLDPRIYDIQDQPIIMQRSIKTARWVLDRCKTDAQNGIFHAGQVDRALSGSPAEAMGNWDADVSSMLGLKGWRSSLWNYLDDGDRPVELFEVWRRHDRVPYLVMMNRTCLINLEFEHLPYRHGLYPYIPVRNQPQAGSFFGLSDLKQTASMYEQMDRMYNLHMDALLLSVIPVWLATKGAGLPADVGTMFQPGRIWTTNMIDAIRPLVKDHPDPDMWRVVADLKANIDETQSTTQPVRGGAVTLNRVSATQSERAFSQSLLRNKTAAIVTETELRPMVHQILFLLRDYVSSDDRVNLGGRDAGVDALKSVPLDKLILALDQDFNFRGATQAVNRQERMAFFKDFFATAQGAGLLMPQEARELLSMWWRESGVPGGGGVITDPGTVAITNQMKMEQARQQAEAVAAAAQTVPVPDDRRNTSDPGMIDPGSAGDMAQVGTTQQPF